MKIESKSMYGLGVNGFQSSTFNKLNIIMVLYVHLSFENWKYLSNHYNMYGYDSCIQSSTVNHQHCKKLTCIPSILIENGDRDKYVKWMAFDKQHGTLFIISSNLHVAI